MRLHKLRLFFIIICPRVQVTLPAFLVFGSTVATASMRPKAVNCHSQVASSLVLALEYFLLMTRVVFLLHTILNFCRK